MNHCQDVNVWVIQITLPIQWNRKMILRRLVKHENSAKIILHKELGILWIESVVQSTVRARSMLDFDKVTIPHRILREGHIVRSSDGCSISVRTAPSRFHVLISK